MNARPLLFDLDHTLIDTHQLKTFLDEEIFRVLPASKDEILASQKEYFASLESAFDFDPVAMATVLAKGNVQNQNKIIEIFFNSEKPYELSLYPDVMNNIVKLGQTFHLGIYSQGNVRFQHAKLNLSGIKKHVSKNLIYIAERKTTDSYLRQLPQNAIVIDDNLDVLQTLASQGDMIPIMINRNKTTVSPNINQISSLDDLLATINAVVQL